MGSARTTTETTVEQPIEQAPAWVRELLSSQERRDALHAEALAEIAKWKRGEPSRVMTFEQLLQELDTAEHGAQAV